MQRRSRPNHLARTARVQKFYDRTTLRHRVRMTPSPNDEKGARRRDGHRAASRSTRTTKVRWPSDAPRAKPPWWTTARCRTNSLRSTHRAHPRHRECEGRPNPQASFSAPRSERRAS